jgi:chemotaxis protein methyltransferase CheR
MTDADNTALCLFFAQLEANTGIRLDMEKSYLLRSRLTPLARELGYADWLAVLHGLVTEQAEGSEERLWQAFEAVMTHETSFFRDSFHFDALRELVLPHLIESNAPKKSLRIWCAGVSTGQEAYSVGILIREHFPQLATWKVEIIASDISKSVIERAQNGIFDEQEIQRGLSPDQIRLFFDRQLDGRYAVRKSSLPTVVFKTFNLTDEWPVAPNFDVLIYFSAELRQNIIDRLHPLINPQAGYLMLGATESILNNTLFKAVKLPRGVLFSTHLVQSGT